MVKLQDPSTELFRNIEGTATFYHHHALQSAISIIALYTKYWHKLFYYSTSKPACPIPIKALVTKTMITWKSTGSMKPAQSTNLTTWWLVSWKFRPESLSPESILDRLLHMLLKVPNIFVVRNIELTHIGEFHVEDQSVPGEIVKIVAGDVLHIDEGSLIKWSSPSTGKGK